jgi:hypothetical protein
VVCDSRTASSIWSISTILVGLNSVSIVAPRVSVITQLYTMARKGASGSIQTWLLFFRKNLFRAGGLSQECM